jgi:hypothetical protein
MVKNVSRLSFTKQLRDYAQFAREAGLVFNLYARATAFENFSKPLKDAISIGLIKFIPIPLP